MKKKILSLAIIALSVISMPLAANARPQLSKNADKNEQVEKKNNFNRNKRNGAKECCMFDNLNLTDVQKEQIKQLNEKRQAERKSFREERHKADSARRVDSQKAYLKDLKAILGQDKYVEFLETYYIANPRGNHKNYGNRRDHKNYGNHRHGNKGFGRTAPAPCPEPCDAPAIAPAD